MVKGSFSAKRGILALLNDRLVFVSLPKKERKEFPISQVTSLKAGTKATGLLAKSGATRKLELQIGQERLRFQLNPYTFSAWQRALEKLAPMIAATSPGPSLN